MARVDHEELELLFNGFILMIKQPERYPTEHMLAVIWTSGHPKFRKNTEELLKQDPLREDVLEWLQDSHQDWVECMPPAVRQQYREAQFAHITLGQE